MKYFALLLVFFSMHAYSETYFVSKTGSDSNDGLSWQNSFSSFQKAYDTAASGDQVWIAHGNYLPTSDFGLNIGESGKHFKLKNGVEFYGGFLGNETSLQERDYTLNITELSGDIGIQNDSTDNSYHVFYHPSGTALNGSAVIDGFTIKSGTAREDDGEHRFGGGMYNWGCSPTIRNCRFTRNSANGYRGGGGAIYNYSGSSPIIQDCIFYKNNANHNGGGVYNLIQCSAQIFNCEFNDNYSEYGAGVFNNRSDALIERCFFIDNKVYYGGGAISVIMANTIIRYSEFTSNKAYGTCGGTIWIEKDASPVISDCLFYGNSIVSETYGPGYGWGGAIYMYNNSTPSIINCTITGNQANYGGGIFVRSNVSYPNSNPIISNCIIYDNNADTAGNQVCVQNGTTIDISYSCFSTDMNDISGSVNSQFCLNSDPNFINSSENLYSLSEYSPCIDAGTNSCVSNTEDFSQNVRIWDGKDDGLSVVDMGAYELNILNSPKNISILNNGTENLLEWQESTLAELYKIYRSTEPYSGFEEIGTSLVSDFTDTDISGSNKYFYKVSAVNGSE